AGTTVNVENVAGTDVQMVQETNYPWDGKVAITVNPRDAKTFAIRIRVPRRGTSELYAVTPQSDGINNLAVNGVQPKPPHIEDGYFVITRQWNAGDKIEFELPLKPQRVKASEKLAADRGLVALRLGPLVYNFEAADNPGMEGRALPTLKADSPL